MPTAAPKPIELDVEVELDPDPVESAEQAGLRYVSDDNPGINRKRVGRGFSYFDVDGKRITDEEERERLKALAIPPALTDVWICPLENGHLQATGRDDQGRKQYIYHPQWQEVRSQNKFNRMLVFGATLPVIRASTKEHLQLEGLPREKVLATVVQLLETTLIRIGNSQYAKKNRSYGLTTMRDRHVEISGAEVKFEFQGKSGIRHEIELNDPRLAAVIKDCQDVTGYELFQYYDEKGDRQQVESGDVNQYLRQITAQVFTAKDFRTWAGTLLATLQLDEIGAFEEESQAKKNVTQAIKNVAKQLGNRPATCRNYYVHPAVIDAYIKGSLLAMMPKIDPDDQTTSLGIHPEEQAVLKIIEQDLQQRHG